MVFELSIVGEFVVVGEGLVEICCFLLGLLEVFAKGDVKETVA
jgi:hypothetical protein